MTGDSTDSGHSQWSEVCSVSFGVHRQANPQMTHGSSNTPLAATFSEVEIVKKFDSLGPQLFEQVANVQGTKIAKVQIDVMAAGEGNTVETYIFKNVVITSFDILINDDGASNTVKFSYESYDYTFFPRDSKNVKQASMRTTGLVGN